MSQSDVLLLAHVTFRAAPAPERHLRPVPMRLAYSILPDSGLWPLPRAVLDLGGDGALNGGELFQYRCGSRCAILVGHGHVTIL